MKIAYDAKRLFENTSGLGNYSRDLLRILLKEYPNNEYLLLNKNKSDRGQNLLKEDNAHFVKVNGIAGRQLNAGKIAQDQGSEIYHGLSGELPLFWNKKTIRKIVTQHDLIFVRYPEYYSFIDRKIHLAKFRNGCEQADIVVAISEATKNDLIDILDVPPEKIQVIYQGCHPIFYQKQNDATLSKVKKNRNLPERFILSVGTVEPRKNLFRSISALRDTNIPLVIVGKVQQKYFQKLQSLITKYKLSQQIIFLSDVGIQELVSLYHLCEFVIYPSEFEGFGIPVLEALSSGKTVITSNVSALPEAGGEHAVYVNPLSIEDIRAKILHLWENKEERLRRMQGIENHLKKFSDKNIADQWQRIYTSII